MPGITPVAEQILDLKNKVNFSDAGTDLVLFLFTNNVTPGEGTVLGDLTQASFSGSTEKTLTGSSWTVADNNPVDAVYAEQEWTAGESFTVYGWGLKRGTALVHVVRDANAPRTGVTGDKITVTPAITCNSTYA